MTSPIQTPPSFAAQEDYWNDRWDRHRGPNAYQRERGEKVLDFIQSLRLSNPRILDLGCATGWFTNWLSRVGRPVGVDLSHRAIEIARERFPQTEYIAGNFYEMAFPPGSFDVIVNQEVIAHVPDQRTFLDQLASIVKPGGYLVITTANKFVMERVNAPADPDSHIKTWLSMKDLKRLLEPRFRVLRTTSVIPMGDKGILRLVNSYNLNRLLNLVFSENRINGWKGQLNLGYSLIALAQRNESST